MIGNKVEINIAAAKRKISRRHYSKIQSYEKKKEMFIDRCLVCLSTPFENYFIIHLSYFIIMSNYVFFVLS